MNHSILQLLEKKRKPLEAQLSEHIERGLIKSSYEPSRPKGRTESEKDFIRRIREENKSFQFVAVNYENVINYVAFGTSGPIISKEGKFCVVPAQVVGGAWGVHHALFYPDIETVRKNQEVFIRIDSGCFSGMVLGDETCDCKLQLETAKQQCVDQGSGVIIEIPGHDGRGWGEFKMANQRLMDELNMTTVEAARNFYEDETLIDQRTYVEAVLIILALGFSKDKHFFQVATNNPVKLQAFKDCKLKLLDPSPVVLKNINACVKRNLYAKQNEWNHNFSFV